MLSDILYYLPALRVAISSAIIEISIVLIICGVIIPVEVSGVANSSASLATLPISHPFWCHLSLLSPLHLLFDAAVYALSTTQLLILETICSLILATLTVTSTLRDPLACAVAFGAYVADIVARDAASTTILVAETLWGAFVATLHALKDREPPAPPSSPHGAQVENPSNAESLAKVVFKPKHLADHPRRSLSTNDRRVQLEIQRTREAKIALALSHLAEDPNAFSYSYSSTCSWDFSSSDSEGSSEAVTPTTSEDEGVASTLSKTSDSAVSPGIKPATTVVPSHVGIHPPVVAHRIASFAEAPLSPVIPPHEKIQQESPLTALDLVVDPGIASSSIVNPFSQAAPNPLLLPAAATQSPPRSAFNAFTRNAPLTPPKSLDSHSLLGLGSSVPPCPPPSIIHEEVPMLIEADFDLAAASTALQTTIYGEITPFADEVMTVDTADAQTTDPDVIMTSDPMAVDQGEEPMNISGPFDLVHCPAAPEVEMATDDNARPRSRPSRFGPPLPAPPPPPPPPPPRASDVSPATSASSYLATPSGPAPLAGFAPRIVVRDENDELVDYASDGEWPAPRRTYVPSVVPAEKPPTEVPGLDMDEGMGDDDGSSRVPKPRAPPPPRQNHRVLPRPPAPGTPVGRRLPVSAGAWDGERDDASGSGTQWWKGKDRARAGETPVIRRPRASAWDEDEECVGKGKGKATAKASMPDVDGFLDSIDLGGAGALPLRAFYDEEPAGSSRRGSNRLKTDDGVEEGGGDVEEDEDDEDEDEDEDAGKNQAQQTQQNDQADDEDSSDDDDYKPDEDDDGDDSSDLSSDDE